MWGETPVWLGPPHLGMMGVPLTPGQAESPNSLPGSLIQPRALLTLTWSLWHSRKKLLFGDFSNCWGKHSWEVMRVSCCESVVILLLGFTDNIIQRRFCVFWETGKSFFFKNNILFILQGFHSMYFKHTAQFLPDLLSPPLPLSPPNQRKCWVSTPHIINSVCVVLGPGACPGVWLTY